VIVERSVAVPEWLCAELAEWVRTAVRTTGRFPSPEVLRLVAELDALDVSYRMAEAATARGLVGWVSVADAARQAGISTRGMRARCTANTVVARKVNNRWQVRVPLRVSR
jgi:hypothetical protein